MPSGIYVVGSAAGEHMNLMTASLVVQVATEPKLVAVAVDVTSHTHELIAAGTCFALSIMARDDRGVVRRFAKPAITSRDAREIAGHPVEVPSTGAPIMARALAWLDCALRSRHLLGSHELFIGEVVAVGGPEGDVAPVLRMEDTRMNYGG